MESPRAPVILLLLAAVILPFLAAVSASDDDNECVYTVYVRTGSIIKGGTDARIGLTLGDASGNRVFIKDLVKWGGLMGDFHDYFERGAVDIFSGRAPCDLTVPICSLNITSDGSGGHHGWFCDYVEVTSTGPHVRCSQSLFYVQQWLSTDAPPYQLYATVDGCDQVNAGSYTHGRGSFVVGKPNEAAGSDASI